MKIDDEIKEEKTIFLNAGSIDTVTFKVTCESVGEFCVDVNGETNSYEVTKAQTGIPGFPLYALAIGLFIAVLLGQSKNKPLFY